MKKTSNDKWLQIGNYVLAKEKNSLGTALCVRAVSGQWSIRWSEDTYVYAVLTRLMHDEKCIRYVEALLTLFFAATNYPHDFAALAETQQTPFINGFTRLVNEQTELELSFKRPATSEEDEAALSEVAEMHDIQEELEKLEEHEGESVE